MLHSSRAWWSGLSWLLSLISSLLAALAASADAVRLVQLLADVASLRATSAEAKSEHGRLVSLLQDLQLKVVEAEAATAAARGEADSLKQQQHIQQDRCCSAAYAKEAVTSGAYTQQ